MAVIGLARRRHELLASERAREEIQDAERRGSRQARLQYPFVDLTRCIGCGGCVRACPEDGVLELVHGQAVVVHGARCVGHGLCAQECPTGAIVVTLADLSERKDIPAITDGFEAKGRDGLFLAGEVTGFALVRTAIAHGTAVADEVAARVGRRSSPPNGTLDLLVVGAGPAGIACSLRAREKGLHFETIDQETLGGTVARYPRRKLVMTQPVDLPLVGRLGRTSYEKEELVEIWADAVRKHELPVRTGVSFHGLAKDGDLFRVRTSEGEVRARHVCLALGRRGSPRKLGVPGEDLHKVSYHLVDAQSYSDSRILVVGGGDSAVEAAIALCQQPGNRVALSYRKEAFSRVKAKNEARLAREEKAGRLTVITRSRLLEIRPDSVRLEVHGGEREAVLGNDQVFIMAGGVPPFKLLEDSGVSFDPEDRDIRAPVAERGVGLLTALSVTLALAAAALAWVLWQGSYFLSSPAERLASPLHPLLRPSGAAGLMFGLLACVLMLFNLGYLLRRSRFGRRLPGSLSGWMSSHLLTGILAYVLVLLHSGMTLRDGAGGHAFLAFTIVMVTGAVGRYFYSFVPRAANGREVVFEEAKARLAALSGEWDRAGRGFGDRVRTAVRDLVSDAPWRHSFRRRLVGLLTGQRRLRKMLAALHRDGLAEGIPPAEMNRLLALAKRAHRTALMVAHFEDLRALLGTWRYLHRWLALLMLLLAGVHIVAAVNYAQLSFSDIWLLKWLGVAP